MGCLRAAAARMPPRAETLRNTDKLAALPAAGTLRPSSQPRKPMCSPTGSGMRAGRKAGRVFPAGRVRALLIWIRRRGRGRRASLARRLGSPYFRMWYRLRGLNALLPRCFAPIPAPIPARQGLRNLLPLRGAGNARRGIVFDATSWAGWTAKAGGASTRSRVGAGQRDRSHPRGILGSREDGADSVGARRFAVEGRELEASSHLTARVQISTSPSTWLWALTAWPAVLQ